MRHLIVLLPLLLLGCGQKPAPVPAAPAPCSAAVPDDTTVRPLAASPAPAAGTPVSFGRDVLPLLSANCLACHGPDNMGGNYAVNSYCNVVAGGSDSTPNVVAGRPDDSRLYACMKEGHPPDAPPDSAALRVVRAWIEQGAKDN